MIFDRRTFACSLRRAAVSADAPLLRRVAHSGTGRLSVASDMEVWNSLHTYPNIDSQRLVVDLYRQAAEGSREKAARGIAGIDHGL